MFASADIDLNVKLNAKDRDHFDRGEILQGLSAGVLVGFVVGSIAFGLATARIISQPEWLRE